LRDFHQKLIHDGHATLEELLEMYKQNWQPLGYADEKHRQLRFDSGIKLLTDYYNKNADRPITHMALEKSFNIKIDGVKFFGRIDRIDSLDGNSVEIIDYKTGTPKNQKEVDNDSQVTIYAIAAKEALGYDPKLLSLYFVETGEKLTTTRTPEQLNDMKTEVHEVLEKMRKGEYAATPGMQCNWCDFKDICPFAYKG
jgi:RecB family exonuclease